MVVPYLRGIDTKDFLIMKYFNSDVVPYLRGIDTFVEIFYVCIGIIFVFRCTVPKRN